MHSEEEVVANVIAILAHIASDAAVLPGKFKNVKAVYLKTHESVALPVYSAPGLSTEDVHEIDDAAHEGVKRRRAAGQKKAKTKKKAADEELPSPDASPAKAVSEELRRGKRKAAAVVAEVKEAGDDDAGATAKKTKKKAGSDLSKQKKRLRA